MVYLYTGSIIHILETMKVSDLYLLGTKKVLFLLSVFVPVVIWFVDFNFTDANNILDHYVIDMSGISSCSPKTKKDGVNPIRSDDPSIKSIVRYCIIFYIIFSNVVTGVRKHNFLFRKKYVLLSANHTWTNRKYLLYCK